MKNKISMNLFGNIMVGKMTFSKLLILTVCFLLIGCAVKSDLPQDAVKQIAGTYKYKVTYFPEKTLVLKDDFTYQLNYEGVIYSKTRQEEGRWEYSKGNVILNSYLDVDLDGSDSFIDKVRTFGFHGDSIVIKIFSLYDDSPFDDFGVLFRFSDSQREDTLVLSDEDGMVCFPREGVKSIIGIYGPHGMGRIDVPPLGYYYIVHFVDCDLSTHKNEKLQLDGDTLIMRLRIHNGFNKLGWKKYKTCEYPYIKVSDSTVFRKE